MRAKDIINVVNDYYGLTWGEMFEQNRSRTCAEARKVAVYLVKKHSLTSWPELANMFHRDISTVRYANKSVKESTNEEGLSRRYKAIEQELKRRGLYDQKSEAMVAHKDIRKAWLQTK